MRAIQCAGPLILTALMSGAAAAADGLEKNLQARLATGEFGEPPCAALSLIMRIVDQGFDDIRYEMVPGAHRIVLVPASSGWRMAFGAPELTVFTQAGFFTMKESTIVTPDGVERPTREYRLTPKGYLASARPSANCFDFLTYRAVELTAADEIAMPERLSGLGKAYRVKFRLHPSEPADWARTPEFSYVFNRERTVGRDVARPVAKEETMFLRDGVWFSERDAMMALALDASMLRQPHMRDQVNRQLAELNENTPDKRAARAGALTPAALRTKLMEEIHRKKLEPCLQLPWSEADQSSGPWKKNAPAAFVFFDTPPQRDKARREYAMELIRRLEKIGMVSAEPFDGAAVAGARQGAGTRYLLNTDAAAALDLERTGCLPLGDAKIEVVRPVGAVPQGVVFRGWARLQQPREWTRKLASQFPNVRSILDTGYGFSGTAQLTTEVSLQVEVQAPGFGLKPPPYRPPLDPPVRKAGPAVVDLVDGGVRMQAQGCTISADGSEVTAAVSCTNARATRGFRMGKAYAEITFRGKAKGANPDTWTNAAVTSQRSLYSLSTGAATFSFAGTYSKRQVTDGDVFGIALDMDAQLLYWHRNGEWMTGRPGSGIGEPLNDTGQEYFIAASVQDKAEGWRINFGATPFRHPPPAGFPPYGAPRDK